VDLADLEARERQGVDVSADLDAAGLTRPGFRYLRTMAALAKAGTVTPAEWAAEPVNDSETPSRVVY
jgi:hypothetical protein